MTDTGTQLAAAQPRRPLRAGGTPLAIVPQTIDDVWKIARYIVMGKMAPDSLTKGRDPEEQTSAVSTIIMSGLELGLSPMVSMRSFGMINGRPGLYGDGLINVCRRASVAEYVKLGFVPGETEEFGDDAYGFCEAKRSDTGEIAYEKFSVKDAKRAGLWQDQALIRKEVWGETRGQKVWRDDVPNDSPWYRYPKRMTQWRAAGYNLRNLFADVLGGIPTMDEIEEVYTEEPMRDVTPVQQVTRQTRPPSPPADDEEEFDAETFVATVTVAINAAPDEESLIATWEGLKVDEQLLEHTQLLDELYEVRDKRLAQFEDQPEEGEQEQPDPDKQRDDAQDRDMSADPRDRDE